jgi:hypothetical protein
MPSSHIVTFHFVYLRFNDFGRILPSVFRMSVFYLACVGVRMCLCLPRSHQVKCSFCLPRFYAISFVLYDLMMCPTIYIFLYPDFLC